MSCPACGDALAPWRRIPGGEPSDPNLYDLLRCESCGSAVTADAPPAPDAYETGQYSRRSPRAAALLARIQAIAARQPVCFLQRAGLPSGGRVLDVGAGRGRLVAALLESGYTAAGIEPSARSVELALDAGVVLKRADLFDHDDADLDAVVFWHVLEHLDDPEGALRRARSWLRPGGLLLVGAPNIGSLQAQLAGDGWLHWDVPRHRVHFTTEGLARLLAGGDFEPLRVHHWVLEQNLHGMWLALLVRLGMRPGFPFHFLKRNIDPAPRDVALTTLGLPLLPVAAALEAGAAAARHGGTVAVIARAA